MALWMKTQQLQGEAFQQVRALYGEHFPIEVRHFLAPWIEDQMAAIDPENPQHEQQIKNLVENLVQELETKAQSMTSEDMVVTKWNLLEATRMFRNRYGQCPSILFGVIRNCLNNEIKLVQQVEKFQVGHMFGTNMNFIQDTAAGEIMQQIELLQAQTQKTNELLHHLVQEQESVQLKYHECTKLKMTIEQLGEQTPPPSADLKTRMKQQQIISEQQLHQQLESIINRRIALLEQLNDTVTKLSSLQVRILDDELLRWKREQQLAGNGAKFNSNLDLIQDWCESVAEIIWFNRQQIKKTEELKQKIPLENVDISMIDLKNLNTKITQLLSSLITSTFIIEKQPPQVMKTNTRFGSTVRLLVGGKLNVHMSPPLVKVSIISEAQANALLKNDNLSKGDASGEILNNSGTMEYHQATRQLSVSFRNMQLKKIKRAEKKGTESVMDEKFSLLFSSQFSVGGGELVYQVWTLSLPVVVIVHGNQEPHAWATVTWDNAFAEPGRAPFTVPEKVTWGQVAEALNLKFTAATGRSLTEDNLKFLGEKAFRNSCPGNDFNSVLLTWTQFCKEPLPERNFTFWEWFYAVMKLTREHLKSFWVDNLIHGFIRKKQAEEMLSTCSNGTFLLRFSDSELGGITIAYVEDNEDGRPQVLMVQPFTSKDFSIRSLADRISDLNDLVNLYPDICKRLAFSKYCTPFNESQSSSNGYVKPLLVTHIPNMRGDRSSSRNPGMGSYPGTPHTMFQPQSPGNVGDSVGSAGGNIQEVDFTEIFANDLPAIDDSMEFVSEILHSYAAKQL